MNTLNKVVVFKYLHFQGNFSKLNFHFAVIETFLAISYWGMEMFPSANRLSGIRLGLKTPNQPGHISASVSLFCS